MPNTRRRKEQEETDRQERLAYVGALAAGLVHEVRTPLHAIQLNAQLLGEQIEALPPDYRVRLSKKCSRIYNEVKALGKTLEAFLTFARPPRLDPTPTDLNHVVHELIEFAMPEMDEAEIRVEANLAPDMYPVILDNNQFTHVLLNLLRNAKEAIDQRRERDDEFFVGQIRLHTAEDDREIRLTIEDNGIGIPPEDEEKIFEVFYTTKEKGTGLGLGIVRRILEDHRGAIHAEPVPPPGARFVITLPRGRFLEFRDQDDTESQ